MCRSPNLSLNTYISLSSSTSLCVPSLFLSISIINARQTSEARNPGISQDLVLENYRYYYSPPDLKTRYIDATPNYMHNINGSASKLAQTYHQDKALASSVRIVYVIRNPIDRMKSSWQHFQPEGHNPILLIISCPTSMYTGNTMDCSSRNDTISLSRGLRTV